MSNLIRTACPSCGKGCDQCFHAGRSYHVDVLERRLAKDNARQIAAYELHDLWTLKVQNAHALTARLGARIHRLRLQARTLNDVRLLWKTLSIAVTDGRGELTDELRSVIVQLDDLLEGERRRQYQKWLESEEASKAFATAKT